MKEFNSSITIIGSGNVANQLAKVFSKEGVNVSHVYGRNELTIQALADQIDGDIVQDIKKLPNQLCIVCVSDDSVVEVINSIPKDIPVAYTSGSIKISAIANRKNVGVFYPLQTFTKDRLVDFFEIPIFIESNDEYFTSTLFELAWTISRTVEHSSSEKRAELHLAAVFVNNFTNHIVHLAQEYAASHDIDFNFLRPLLKETIDKLDSSSALQSQTGPAKRNDLGVINAQESKLSGDMKQVYKALTQSIIKTYHKDDKL